MSPAKYQTNRPNKLDWKILTDSPVLTNGQSPPRCVPALKQDAKWIRSTEWTTVDVASTNWWIFHEVSWRWPGKRANVSPLKTAWMCFNVFRAKGVKVSFNPDKISPNSPQLFSPRKSTIPVKNDLSVEFPFTPMMPVWIHYFWHYYKWKTGFSD